MLSVESSLHYTLNEGVQLYKKKHGSHQQVFFRCCTACGYAHVTKHFQSCSNGNTFPIQGFINCNSKFFIYLITCTACRTQYVACTGTPLKVRIRRHLYDASIVLGIYGL